MIAYLSWFGRQTTEVTTTTFIYSINGPCIVTSYDEYVGKEDIRKTSHYLNNLNKLK